MTAIDEGQREATEWSIKAYTEKLRLENKILVDDLNRVRADNAALTAVVRDLTDELERRKAINEQLQQQILILEKSKSTFWLVETADGG
jgi:hypothetical protein